MTKFWFGTLEAQVPCHKYRFMKRWPVHVEEESQSEAVDLELVGEGGSCRAGPLIRFGEWTPI